MNAIRNLRIPREYGLFIGIETSAGVSFETGAVGAKVVGSEGGVLNQLGVSCPNVNVTGCLDFCLGAGGSYSVDKSRFTSVEYFGGAGKPGGDISGGLSYTDIGVYMNVDRNIIAIKNPI